MGRWNVADVMTIGAISVQEDTPFKEIVDLLEAHEINAAPVVDGFDRVVGVVSSSICGCSRTGRPARRAARPTRPLPAN